MHVLSIISRISLLERYVKLIILATIPSMDITKILKSFRQLLLLLINLNFE